MTVTDHSARYYTFFSIHNEKMEYHADWSEQSSSMNSDTESPKRWTRKDLEKLFFLLLFFNFYSVLHMTQKSSRKPLTHGNESATTQRESESATA